jgi:hypothetical protein
MPREGGASSNHDRGGKTFDSGDYWIVRRSLSSGWPLRAGPVDGR